MVGIWVLIGVVGIAVFGPVLTNLDPIRTDLGSVREPPGLRHLLGTDLSGRDVLSRVIFGTRTSLIVGVGAVLGLMVIGIVVGLSAGYSGGVVDQVLMRLADAVLSLPILLLVIVFVSIVGPSVVSVIVVIALLGWPGTARLVRAQVLSLREAEFVTAARVIGADDVAIMGRHLLPNIVASLTVIATLAIGNAILLEAALSFLGLGVRPPVPSLGVMINDALSPRVLIELPWDWLPPAAVISITVLAVNFVGDGLREAVDPRAVRRA